MSAPEGFSPALKALRADSKGRVSIGTLNPHGATTFYAAIDPQGRILLTPDTHDDSKEANRG